MGSRFSPSKLPSIKTRNLGDKPELFSDNHQDQVANQVAKSKKKIMQKSDILTPRSKVFRNEILAAVAAKSAASKSAASKSAGETDSAQIFSDNHEKEENQGFSQRFFPILDSAVKNSDRIDLAAAANSIVNKNWAENTDQVVIASPVAPNKWQKVGGKITTAEKNEDPQPRETIMLPPSERCKTFLKQLF